MNTEKYIKRKPKTLKYELYKKEAMETMEDNERQWKTMEDNGEQWKHVAKLLL